MTSCAAFGKQLLNCLGFALILRSMAKWVSKLLGDILTTLSLPSFHSQTSPHSLSDFTHNTCFLFSRAGHVEGAPFNPDTCFCFPAQHHSPPPSSTPPPPQSPLWLGLGKRSDSRFTGSPASHLLSRASSGLRGPTCWQKFGGWVGQPGHVACGSGSAEGSGEAPGSRDGG